MALSEDLVNAKPPLVIEKITMTTMQMLLANESNGGNPRKKGKEKQ